MPRRVLLDWRDVGPPSENPWRRVGYFNAGRFRIAAPTAGAHWLRARLENDGRVGPAREFYVDPLKASQDVPLVQADLPTGEAAVDASGVVTITTKAPPSDVSFSIEARVGKKSEPVTSAVEAGTADAGEPILHNGIGEAESVVHLRAVDNRSGEVTEWKTDDIATPATPTDDVDQEDNGGTDLTGITQELVHSEETIENDPGGGIRLKAMRPMWATDWPASIWGMDDGPPLWGMDRFWPEGRAVVDSGDKGALHDFLPVVNVEASAMEVDVPSIWGSTGPIYDQRYEDLNGDTSRTRDRNLGMWDTNYDQGGIRFREEIACSDDGSPPTAYQDVRHGHRYRARRCVRRFTLLDRYGFRRWKVAKFRTVRRIKNRKHEVRTEITGGTMVVNFAAEGIPEFLDKPHVTFTVEGATASTATYSVHIDSVTTTQVQFSIKDVKAGGTVAPIVPTSQNVILHILGV